MVIYIPIYIKKYANIFNNEQYKDFASPETMNKETEDTLVTLDPNDPTFEARKYNINRERGESLNTVESMIVSKKNNGKNLLFLTLNKRSKTA